MTAEDYDAIERAQQAMEERGWRAGTLNGFAPLDERFAHLISSER